jgi:hypothetical protein
MDPICPFCSDVMTCWAKGRYALQLCFGAGAPDERWECGAVRRAGSWRCSRPTRSLTLRPIPQYACSGFRGDGQCPNPRV